MHESRLVADLVNRIEEELTRSGARRVTGVRIEIGALSHVTPESLREHLVLATGESAIGEPIFEITKATDTSDPTALDVRLVSISVADD